MIFAFVVFVNAQNSTFKITTWNTEWLSCSINGPTDEQLQVNNVAKVIKALDVDVVLTRIDSITTNGFTMS